MAIGDIGAVIEDKILQAITTGRGSPRIVHATGDIYVVSYHSDSTPGQGAMFTTTITAAGAITADQLDEIDFGVSAGLPTPEIIKVTNGLIAVAYSDPAGSNAHTIQTYTVSALGIFGLVDTKVTTGSSGHPQLHHITGDIYALLYHQGTGIILKLSTFDIASDGTITAFIDFDNTINSSADNLVRAFDLVRVRGTIAVCAYADRNTSDGFILTFDITDAGVVTEAALDTLEHNGSFGTVPALAVLDTDIGLIAMIYRSSSSGNTEAKTFLIASDGTITATDTSALGGLSAVGPGIMNLGENHFISSDEGSAVLRTFHSDSDGNISGHDTLSGGFAVGQQASFIALSRTVVAMVIHETAGGDNVQLVTFGVENLVGPVDSAIATAGLLGMQQREILL